MSPVSLEGQMQGSTLVEDYIRVEGNERAAGAQQEEDPAVTVLVFLVPAEAWAAILGFSNN
jgi:hypothetical protein